MTVICLSLIAGYLVLGNVLVIITHFFFPSINIIIGKTVHIHHDAISVWLHSNSLCTTRLFIFCHDFNAYSYFYGFPYVISALAIIFYYLFSFDKEKINNNNLIRVLVFYFLMFFISLSLYLYTDGLLLADGGRWVKSRFVEPWYYAIIFISFISLFQSFNRFKRLRYLPYIICLTEVYRLRFVFCSCSCLYS